MRLCRFAAADDSVHPGLFLQEDTILELEACSASSLERILERDDLIEHLESLREDSGQIFQRSEVRLLAPVEKQEVWAAGVTYLRSRVARTEESEHDASAYDRVYDADRPELFFKSNPEKVVGPGEAIGVRKDSRWTVPEPELTFVINSQGTLVGYTIGNDVSARDIEGENLLYLPQAKIYDRSCAIGPWIEVGCSEGQIRTQKVRLDIVRSGQPVFGGETPLENLKRPFENLVQHLFACQSFPHGALLLTGTGIIPPDDFSLRPQDSVRIEISGMGVLENPVVEV
jgi:2-dehydro-3-deoxy-D-arabinonate dehydratase